MCLNWKWKFELLNWTAEHCILIIDIVIHISIYVFPLRMVSGSWDNVIRLWDRQTGNCVAQTDDLHNGPLSRVRSSTIPKLYHTIKILFVLMHAGHFKPRQIMDNHLVKRLPSEKGWHSRWHHRTSGAGPRRNLRVEPQKQHRRHVHGQRPDIDWRQWRSRPPVAVSATTRHRRFRQAHSQSGGTWKRPQMCFPAR